MPVVAQLGILDCVAQSRFQTDAERVDTLVGLVDVIEDGTDGSQVVVEQGASGDAVRHQFALDVSVDDLVARAALIGDLGYSV